MKDQYICKCGGESRHVSTAFGNRRCILCAKVWYGYHCWHCKEPIDSRVTKDRCSGRDCNWYICPKCGRCSSEVCSDIRKNKWLDELEGPEDPLAGLGLGHDSMADFIREEANGDPDMARALMANMDYD